MQTGTTSTDKILEAQRWRIGRLNEQERQFIEYRIRKTRQPSIQAIMQSANLYGYCAHNPITFDDPDGTSRKKPNSGPRKPKRHGADKRRPTGQRERNVGHPDEAEHSRVAKEPRNPNRPPNTYRIQARNAGGATLTAVAVVGGGYLIWTGAKWIAAVLLSPATGGGSLVLAAVTP